MTKFSKFLLIVLLAMGCEQRKEYEFPYLDPELTPEARAKDLVGRMTLDEKISQTMNAAPAIDRLGIPEYNWWNECLHGVARAGLATVFPQAIGLAAIWDEPTMFRIATAISDEARAKHHEFVRKNKRLIYQGLTMWSPNINLFRDPRWGRGQETYGEDPYLTGRLAVQFIKGLQGDDPRYFKTIATVKHFAVHSGPEPERHVFDAVVSEKDFRETYLPQFEMGIKEAKAYSVMCAYNRINGDVCCASDALLTKLLRDEWGFSGYVVSDCGAITDIYKDHKVVATPAEAAALAVKSGCDLECLSVYKNLKEAVEKKFITEEEITVSVERLFVARIRLGMFDPPEMVQYTKIPYNVVDSKENKELAAEAARKSIVLLKNTPASGSKEKLLPLKKDLKTIAVVGPNADQWLMLLGNYNGVPSDPVTPLRGIREKVSTSTKVLYAQGCELAEGMPVFESVPSEVLHHGEGQQGLKIEYYSNREMNGEPLYEDVAETIDINWSDRAPRQDMDNDNFGVRWSGEIKPDQTGLYQLGVISTCKTSLYLNDSVIAKTEYHFRDEFPDPRLRKSIPIMMEAGKKYAIRIDAGESYADAQVQLVWGKPRANPKNDLKKEALRIVGQSDVVVMCMGITARLEGEQMDVEIAGFRGGDRTTMDLPVVQQELIKEIQAVGKPVVLVMLNGSAMSINWEEKNIPAIVEAWYPGQAAGRAIADVLFGDYNPAGRLPITFYKSLKDLPDFADYNAAGHTYRYFKGEPLYPFGYGLSYTTFAYENLQVNNEIKLGDTLKFSVSVKNSGSAEGDEVIQVYLSHRDAPAVVPVRALKAFRRIHLAPGESKKVDFVIEPGAFGFINDLGKPEKKPGKFELSVGGGQPGAKGAVTVGATINMN